MTFDEFQMYLKSAQKMRLEEQARLARAVRVATGADDKQFTQIMKELES